MEKIVYVVTNCESGWDCVEGVYTTREKAVAFIKDRYPNDEIEDTMLVIHEERLR
jgi:hypothetical protein